MHFFRKNHRFRDFDFFLGFYDFFLELEYNDNDNDNDNDQPISSPMCP